MIPDFRCRRSARFLACIILLLLGASSAAKAQSGSGACCLSAAGGGCQIMTGAQCAAAPGILLDGQACTACNQPFGCCAGPLATCQTMSAASCAAQRGSLYSSCSPDPCVATATPNIGACCNQNTGACAANTIQSQCIAPNAFLSGLACAPNPCAGLGACCTLAGDCTFVTTTGCNGTWLANTSCTNAACGQTGTCCNFQTAECTWTNFSSCQGATLQFTVGGICLPGNQCYMGACCWGAGFCVHDFRADCFTWYPQPTFLLNATCSPNSCITHTGACCLASNANGGCAVVVPSQCGANSSFTPGGTCFPNICPSVLGACCCPGGGCTIAPQTSCNSTGHTLTGNTLAMSCNWFPNQLCSTLTCPQIGACCAPGGPGGTSCTLTTLANCSTTSGGVVTLGQWRQNITCSPDPCGAVGACCDPTSGACSLIIGGGACIGVWHANYPCVPNPCQRGGCCNPFTPSCTISTRADCNAHGLNWLGDGVACLPSLCVNRSGACCNPAPGSVFCTITSQFACSATWHANSTCAPNPCCAADIDGNNALAVADIFSFLNIWFAGCP